MLNIWKSESTKTIPQITAVVKVTKNGKMHLRKSVRNYLGLIEKRNLFLGRGGEILISPEPETGEPIELDEKNRIHLPKEVLEKLQISQGIRVALVERGKALALKLYKVGEVEGKQARWLDMESQLRVKRQIETNPMPQPFLTRLSEEYRHLRLKHNIYPFLKNRGSMEALLLRQILDLPDSCDMALRQRLIEERLEKQAANGSWESSVTVTARFLKELGELGLGQEERAIKKGITWLLDRPQSKYNPGLWFATDDLVKEQEEVIARRNQYKGKGPRERFNRTKPQEIKLVKAGDALIDSPCGPRIIWTSALVLEALLFWKCEEKERASICFREGGSFRDQLLNPCW